MDGLDSRMKRKEKTTSELEDKIMEITQPEKQRENRLKKIKNRQSPKDLRDYIPEDLFVIGSLEIEEKEGQVRKCEKK